jgi:riboflavin synthase
MFTGLVESLGSLVRYGEDTFQISIIDRHFAAIISDLAIGDSVAVDGVCLTVETITEGGFIATVSPETLQRSTLGTRDRVSDYRRSRAAEYVNLETSLRVGSKIGGHFVTGHIDGVGCLIESTATERAWLMRFGMPAGMEGQWCDRIGRYLVPKGSIAVNGISLTVADCAPDSSWFTAAVIPHTYSYTNLNYLKSGDLVNLESDILGKYVDKLINHRQAALDSSVAIELSFLAEHGYV